jgi:hypothetical protein
MYPFCGTNPISAFGSTNSFSNHEYAFGSLITENLLSAPHLCGKCLSKNGRICILETYCFAVSHGCLPAVLNIGAMSVKRFGSAVCTSLYSPKLLSLSI